MNEGSVLALLLLNLLRDLCDFSTEAASGVMTDRPTDLRSEEVTPRPASAGAAGQK